MIGSAPCTARTDPIEIDLEALAKGGDVLIFNQRRLAGDPSICA
jgi:hypothetical protein